MGLRRFLHESAERTIGPFEVRVSLDGDDLMPLRNDLPVIAASLELGPQALAASCGCVGG